MAYSWSYVSLGLLHSYPELLLASLCFLFLYFQLNKKPTTPPTNYPFLGMLPAVLINIRNVHDWIAHGLRENGCTFRFRGPWFLGMDLLITSDPANVHHVFSANFANYPKGAEFAEIFDVLGDGIFNADGERWRALRRAAHALMGRPRFRSFVAECSRDKVETGLVPLLSRLAERGSVVDLQDMFLRLTFDMTCDLVLGVDPGSLSVEFPDVPFTKAMDDIMEAAVFRHVVPSPFWKLMRWLRVWKEKKLWEAWEVIDCFVTQNLARSKGERRSCQESLLASYINEQSDTIESDYKFVRDTKIGATRGVETTTGGTEAPAASDIETTRVSESCQRSLLASYINKNEQPNMIEIQVQPRNKFDKTLDLDNPCMCRTTSQFQHDPQEDGIEGDSPESTHNKSQRATKISSDSDNPTFRPGPVESVDYKFVRDTTVNLMFAGRDTTAVALAWFFWLLSKNPGVELKILQELKEHLVDDHPSSAEELSKLVYLHAALCETLRLYPPVPFEHKAPVEADVLPSGEEAPPGRKILFSAYAMGRVEGVWGEDCLVFRPERWISERGRLRHEPSYKFLSFNCGPRTCLGKDIAFTQMKAVVAAVLCNFDVEGVGGHVVEPKLSVILQMKNGWKVRIKKKKKKEW